MADFEENFGSTDSLEKSAINSSFRHSISRIQNIQTPTPYSSSSVEPASIVDSQDTASLDSEALVILVNLI
jgi:hypothetical protein